MKLIYAVSLAVFATEAVIALPVSDFDSIPIIEPTKTSGVEKPKASLAVKQAKSPTKSKSMTSSRASALKKPSATPSVQPKTTSTR